MASLAEIMVSFVGTVPMSLRSAVHRGLEFYGFSPQWRLRKQGRNLAHLNIDRLGRQLGTSREESFGWLAFIVGIPLLALIPGC